MRSLLLCLCIISAVILQGTRAQISCTGSFTPSPANAQERHCYFVIGGGGSPMLYADKPTSNVCLTAATAATTAMDATIVSPYNVYPAVANCNEEIVFLQGFVNGLTGTAMRSWMGYTWDTNYYYPDDRHSGFRYSTTSYYGYWPFGSSPATAQCIVLDATTGTLETEACTGLAPGLPIICEFDLLEDPALERYVFDATHPNGLMFPYGDTFRGASDVGDTVMDKTVDGNSGPLTIPFLPNSGFKYFGSTYHELHVNANGDITFDDSFYNYYPDELPIGVWKLIAPYWTDTNIENKGGDVFYRALNNRADDLLLFELAEELICASDLVNTPEPVSWMFVATWDHVAYYGSDAHGCIVNTFQAILIADEAGRTFVIFNYHDINWHSATSDGGNRDDGTGGGPATAGFNDGSGFSITLPGSNDPVMLLTLDERTNIGKKGRWFYRVDEADPEEVSASDFPPLCPFGDSEGDTYLDKTDEEAVAMVTLPLSPFNFYDTDYATKPLHISANGVLSFDTSVPAYNSIQFPTTANALIAPFWSDIDTTKAGKVSYRVLDSTTDGGTVRSANIDLFTKIDDIVCQAGAVAGFESDWLLIATWQRVAFKGTTVNCNVVNTFQVVLARGGANTFAIFNYNGVSWSSGVIGSGSPTTGVNGTPAHVGFNKGDGINFYYPPEFYNGNDVITLDVNSNVNEAGRWAFQIDGAEIGGPTGPLFSFQALTNKTVWEFEEVIELTVLRSGGCTPVAATILLDIVPGGTNATDSEDFSRSSVEVSFDAAATEAKVNINIIDDTDVEGLESIELTIDPQGYGSTTSPSTIQICIQDDDILNVFCLAQYSYEVIEGSNYVRVTILRQVDDIPGIPALGGLVYVMSARQSASDPVDFTVINTVAVQFEPGQNSRTLDIFLLNDRVIEEDEFFKIMLLDPEEGKLCDLKEATVTIIDDDSTYRIQTAAYKGDESALQVEIVVLRDGDLQYPGSVRLIKEPNSGTATPGQDYPIDVVIVNFPPNVPSQPAFIKFTNDQQVEADETFFVKLITPVNGFIVNTRRSEITIENDDSSFSFSSRVYNGAEQDEKVVVTIERQGNIDRSATVYIRTSSSKRKRRQAALPGSDYVAIDEPVVFAIGQSSKMVEITLGDDNAPERGESFFVSLYLPDDDINNSIGDIERAQITIFDDETFVDREDDEAALQLGSNLYVVFENDRQVTVSIVRESNERTCSVRLSTRPSSQGSPATSGSDYTSVNEVIEFIPGITEVDFSIDIGEDISSENIETFEVFLSDAIGCDIGANNAARVEIYDNDLQGQVVRFRLSNSEYEVRESEQDLTAAVIRYGDLQDTVSVYIRTTEVGSATPVADFTPLLSSRITFGPGQQLVELPIRINDDGFTEGSESFRVELFNPSGGILDPQNAAQVTIVDDDFEGDFPESYLSFQQSRIEVLESAREVRVVILRENYQLQTVDVIVSSEALGIDGATSSDYDEVAPTRIEFAPGVSSYTLVVPIYDDFLQEAKEAFRLRLSQSNNGVLGDVAEVDVYIIDDDSSFTLSESQYTIYEDARYLRAFVGRDGYLQRTASVRIESMYISNGAQREDFESLSETLKFPIGRDYVEVEIRIFNDEIVESNEEFQLSLSTPVNGSLGVPSLANVEIYDDDSRGSGKEDVSTTALILGIVGGVVGAIALIIFIVILVYCCYMMSNRSSTTLSPLPAIGRGGQRPPPGPYNNRGYAVGYN